MNKWIIISLVVLLIVIVVIVAMVMNKPSNAKDTIATPQTIDGPVTCTDMACLGTNFLTCVPSVLNMSSEGQAITITVKGFVDEKCGYQMKFGDAIAADCNFARQNLTQKVLNQMFGNPEGQDAIIAASCKQ